MMSKVELRLNLLILAIQKQMEELGCEFTYECKRNV